MTKKQLTLSQACAGMIYYKQAIGRSPNTIESYRNSFKKLDLFFSDDPPIASITRHRFLEFLVWLQNEHVSEPRGVAPRGPIRLSPKTIHGIYANCATLWSWAVQEAYVHDNIVHGIDAPEYEPPAVETLTKDDIKALLKACATTNGQNGRPGTQAARATADRDQAIVLVLLDTGIRASELCDITIGDVNMSGQRIRVAGKGSGRDKKERYVSFGRSTARALWRYVTPRVTGDTRPEDPFFCVDSNGFPRPMDRQSLCHLLRRLGERAGIGHRVHPHKFRHTFAVTYLRNGGDPFTLQEQLGHTDLTMVRHYVRLASADVAAAHRRASPVDNWRL